MKRTLAPSKHSTTDFIMENYLTYAGDSTDIFEALGISEEWEDVEETPTHAQEDAKVLAEYGY